MDEKRLMLYFHIPFCISKCAYCAFYSAPCTDSAEKERFKNAVINQVRSTECDEHEITSIYFGGGTPTVLGTERLTEILASVKSHFRIASDAEITVEANPGTVNAAELAVLRKAGFNRLSIGAQSLNDITLKLLNRRHTSKEFVSCFYAARSAGFDNISVDLIFGLPNENADMLRHSVREILCLSPEHISVYELTLEEGTPLYRQQAAYTFPNEDEAEKQYRLVCELLATAGYEHYEISNFARKGMFSRHNCGYWKRLPYIGFGPSAHSFFENKRFFAVSDTKAYISGSTLGAFAAANYATATEISPEEAEEERIMLGLRLAEGIKLGRCSLSKRVFDDGFAVYENGVLRLTEKGFRVSNTIISALI